ncbi:MAG TPA: (2Fe-2S)-binding protein [Firmicutes bacterium]|nr:(2Fe-2S)-binding protein [Candidatus Fermentithermobacillaceae bacterium]
MRITSHPILGDEPPARTVKIQVDGKTILAKEGETIAAALLAAGIRVNRYTQKRHEPRGIFCGIGQCTDCVMVVNGVPNVKTCVTPVAEGMVIETQHGLGGLQHGTRNS